MVILRSPIRFSSLVHGVLAASLLRPARTLLIVSSFAFGSLACAQTASFSYAIASLGGGSFYAVGVAVDGSGNIYLAESYSGTVQEMPAGCASSSCVTNLGGGFNQPWAVSVDGNGNVYVADSTNNAVKEMPPGCASVSCVTTLGGGFSYPAGVAVDGNGNVYVADVVNNAVKEMPAGCASSSCVTTLGGGFSEPWDVAVDRSGNVYVADYGNYAVKEMPAGCASSSCVTTLGGGFYQPAGVAVDISGNVYVADTYNWAVKEMPAGCASSSCVTTLGTGFRYPYKVAADDSGNVYVADSGHDAVKEIMTRAVDVYTVPVGTVSPGVPLTFNINSAGSLSSTTPFQVLTQGAANLDFNVAVQQQQANACNGTTNYTAGSICTVSVNFTPTKPGPRNGAVELLNAGGSPIATVPVYGTGQGPQFVFSPATQSALGGGFSAPVAVAVDGSGNVYVADDYNHALKEIPAGCASSSCVITLGGSIYIYEPTSVAVDGAGNVYETDWGDISVKEIPVGCVSSSCVIRLGGPYYKPTGVAVDSQGNVYVADESWGDAVYEMPPGCTSSTCMTALGGSNTLSDPFIAPWGLAVDASGNVYVANYGNQYGSWAVFEMPPQCLSSSCVTTLGGGFDGPTSVAVDASGNVYVGSEINNVVNVMPAGCASSSCVTTLGSGFTYPQGVAVDGSGNVYVADANNTIVTEIKRATAPSLSFAATTDGTISSDSPQTVTVENVGNAALNFPIPATGDNPSISANFTLNNSGASACPLVTASSANAGTLAAGGRCEMSISFTPTAPATGSVTGTLAITDTNLNAGAPNYATQSIQLQGTAIATSTPAILTLPSPGLTTILGATNVSFQWTSSGASEYQLTLGTTAGASDLYSYKGTATSTTVPTLPANGVTLYATLYSQVNGVWHSNAYLYTESGTAVPAVLTSPTPGVATILGTTNVAFQWSAGTGVTEYQLNLSAIAPGQSELFTYKGTALTATAPSLPKDGIPVYATLYSLINGTWQSNNYVYTESGTSPGLLTSPTPGVSTILGTTGVTFQWTTGAGVALYQLNLSAIGPGGSDLFLYKGTATTATATTLPANGATVYATLYSSINGAWISKAYEYTESGTPTPATLQSPTPGLTTILGTSGVPFTWSSGGGVSLYQLNLSATTKGAGDLYSYKGAALTTTVPAIPANGVTVYATLYSLIKGTWQSNSYVYTESGSPTLAALTSPTPGLSTILGTTNVLFQWSPATSATLYQLNLSAVAPGGSDLYLYKGTALSATAPTLPANGVKVYARLYSYIDGVWLHNDYVYTEQ
jgi:sugar lactone lactonase YvrE